MRILLLYSSKKKSLQTINLKNQRELSKNQTILKILDKKTYNDNDVALPVNSFVEVKYIELFECESRRLKQLK